MAVDLKLNHMIDLHGLLDALEQAVLDDFEAQGIPDNDWDDETQRDIDGAKMEAAARKELIRTRILHKAMSLYPGDDQ
ncbi:MAG: hypothetical protein ACO3AD_18760 [Burkholderiaceae bacterium]